MNVKQKNEAPWVRLSFFLTTNRLHYYIQPYLDRSEPRHLDKMKETTQRVKESTNTIYRSLNRRRLGFQFSLLPWSNSSAKNSGLLVRLLDQSHQSKGP